MADRNTATYLKSMGKHSINLLAGFTAQAYQSEYSAVGVAQFEDATGGIDAIQEVALKQMTVSGYDAWQMLPYLARVNYNYDNRYLLTLTGRIDGSSKSGKTTNMEHFRQLSHGEHRKKASFKNNKHISNLKLRTSYGLVGNQGIASYSALGLLYATEAYFVTRK